MLKINFNHAIIVKALWLALGFAGLGMGVIGVFVPGMPSTVFLLIALWGFSRGSQRFHDWLYNHPRLGPPLRAWHEHRAIPLAAKLAAFFGMSLGYVGLSVMMGPFAIVPLIYAAVNILAALYVGSRPSRAPTPDTPLVRPASLGVAHRAFPYR